MLAETGETTREDGAAEIASSCISCHCTRLRSLALGKFFPVEMTHQRIHWACSFDIVGLKVKGLDKNNMSNSSDVTTSTTG